MKRFREPDDSEQGSFSKMVRVKKPRLDTDPPMGAYRQLKKGAVLKFWIEKTKFLEIILISQNPNQGEHMAPAPNAMRTEQKLNSNDKNTKRTVLVLGFWTHQILNSSSVEETLFHPKKSRLHVPRHLGSGIFFIYFYHCQNGVLFSCWCPARTFNTT